MEEFNNLKRVAMSELRKLDSQYANKDQFSEADVKMYDCLMHALKCQLTACAMLEAEEYGDEESGMSGRRGRSMTTGRYISRESGENTSYADGYTRGYSEAMNQMNHGGTSGHYPMEPVYYPRRW